WLLGVRGDRPPNRRGAEKCDELSPSHATRDLRGCQSVRCRTPANTKAIAASRSAGAHDVCCGVNSRSETARWMGPLYPRKQTVSLQRRRCPPSANALNRCRDNRCADWVALEARQSIILERG